ncbi:MULTISPECIES: DUF1848 domain-containing protein [unclassified Carboxylicivirga]|uniref:DUF1848 domain-containing protein n=1 Tax=Carboxylicivirga TaxID=1628153 RepID=UPI003D343834
MKNWEKTKIQNDDGEIVEAIAPVIISASRSTDIPAFYSKWFFNRLKQGYVVWINPFNRKAQYVSFEKTRAIVFWTKNPKPIMPYLPILDEMKIKYYFQYTLNDYEKENLEPNIPSLEKRLDTFIKLSNQISKEKVIWRYDPLLLSDNISVDSLINRIASIGEKINQYTNKLVFSYADISCYQKVRKNLSGHTNSYREFSEDEMNLFAEKLQKINENWKLKLATCAELVELEKFGIEHNRCVDDELIYSIGKDDKILSSWLGFENSSELTLFDNPAYSANKKLKDKGQRKECGCVISKDIGMYNTCNHLCSYCYANHSDTTVQKNINLHNEERQSII